MTDIIIPTITGFLMGVGGFAAGYRAGRRSFGVPTDPPVPKGSAPINSFGVPTDPPPPPPNR